MKKILVIISLMPLLVAAQDEGKKFKLDGKIGRMPDSFKVDWVFLQYRDNGESKVDSVQPENGRYSFTGIITEPVLARLRIKFAETQPGRKPVTVLKRDMVAIFIEPGKQKVASADSFSHINVRSSKAHKEFSTLSRKVKPYDDRITPLVARYNEYGKAKDRISQEKTEAEIDAINEEKKEKVYAEYVKGNPASPIAMYALQQYAGWDVNADNVEPLYNLLTEKAKNLPSAVTFKESLEIAKKTGLGKIAMDFTQNDTLGKPVSLSSFKGKYLLIDFWASWCGPCRAENPNIVKVFNKYKSNNFHIIGVSLDRPGQKERWLKAIHDDGLAWTQVSDLQYWDNEVARQYGIRAIPQNLLLDPEGKIIAKNLRGEDLDQKLGAAIVEKKGF